MLATIWLGADASAVNGADAGVGFVRNGTFEVCLNDAYTDWLRKQAELAVNQDPRAKILDDAAVAAWTAATLADCRKKAAAEAGSIDRFERWREAPFAEWEVGEQIAS
jgi:hypothetical protein